MGNERLNTAKSEKNDEFYTLFMDIQKEINHYIYVNPDLFKNKTVLLPCDDPEWSKFTRFFAQNFEQFGLKKLISTSYANSSKNVQLQWNPTTFETESSEYDKSKSETRGKIFVLDHDTNNNGVIDFEDLEWHYLEGDGDFRSEEVKRLRDEADIIVTNPPFSLFREFLTWLVEANKQFIILGNMNAITYKEVFPLIREEKLWLGASGFNTGMYFRVPDNFKYASTYKFEREQNGVKVNRVPGVCWFTNIDHGKRHSPLQLMTEADNIKFSRHKEVRGIGYRHYDNYDAIEVPYTDAIPSDYKGIMGVPISFLDKHCPEQFDIVGATGIKGFADDICKPKSSTTTAIVDGKCVYKRIFIQYKN